MKAGFRAWDADTHVNPAAEVLERYVDPGLRPRLAELEPYRTPSGKMIGGTPDTHQIRVGTKFYRRVLGQALERTRTGRGPALVEAVVTQLRHDPPAHRDPVERLRRLLDARGEWTSTFQDVVEAEARGRFEQAFQALEADA